MKSEMGIRIGKSEITKKGERRWRKKAGDGGDQRIREKCEKMCLFVFFHFHLFIFIKNVKKILRNIRKMSLQADG